MVEKMAKYMGGGIHKNMFGIRPLAQCLILFGFGQDFNFGASLQKNSRTVILQIVHSDWMSHIQSCSKIPNSSHQYTINNMLFPILACLGHVSVVYSHL